ncbi:SdpI family protein [Flexithrix dorotheae]|uniref:SdpI family protein n=1 Tax=Flexithrix dorotheae TaxID=70993 RepID=UPI00036D46B0|nr:SdpI family protein [Flexithrix dorotheae]
MSRKKSLEVYNSLDDEQKEIISTKKISGNQPASAWLERLKKVALMDHYGDTYRKNQTYAILMVFIGIAGFILTVICLANEFYYGLVIPVLAVIGIVLIYKSSSKFNKMDLTNHLRLFIVPLLAILKEESRKKEKIDLEINLNNPCEKDNIVETIPNSNKKYPKVKTTFYDLQWMSGKAKLQDQTQLHWTVNDLVRKRDITKKNPRGKIKFKTKYKVKHNVNLKLSIPKESYELVKNPNENQPVNGAYKMAYVSSDRFHVFKIRSTDVSATLDESVKLNHFLGTITKAYKHVKPI